ncbi:hypothetical protein ACHAW5_004647 [Stephanodiscus triporus]|uniref:Uncharacterized protein n=1 Tax=Stephanodiscus triporus TaxID=2934178 RepID=A0ABD3MGH3_9STRA
MSLTCDAGRPNEKHEIDARVVSPLREVDEKTSCGIMEAGAGMHPRRDSRQLSAIAHLTEQNNILKQRVATLEAENEEMGDEMDYLIHEIILLRVEKKGQSHTIKEVDVSGSLGSLMIESLSEDGDYDYYSYDDNDDDANSDSVPPMVSPLRKRYVSLLTEEVVVLSPTPCREEGDLIVLHQEDGSANFVDAVDDGGRFPTTMKNPAASASVITASPVQSNQASHNCPQKTLHFDDRLRSIHLLTDAPMSATELGGNMQMAQAVNVVEISSSIEQRTGENSNVDSSIIFEKNEIANSESVVDQADLDIEKIVLSDLFFSNTI